MNLIDFIRNIINFFLLIIVEFFKLYLIIIIVEIFKFYLELIIFSISINFYLLYFLFDVIYDYQKVKILINRFKNILNY